MEVVCIKENKTAYWEDGRKAEPGPKLTVGNEYIVIGEYSDNDGVCFYLAGFPENEVYHHSLFAILSSGIDETELVNERELIEA